ncbi:MAG: 50S ribosomal protein L6 [Promethearchaeota archaeon]|nr:MAG: 50S ribosomal protein L6 [Candidatus Lokiarchaeota archaeon]
MVKLVRIEEIYEIPQDVTFSMTGKQVTVKGKQGSLTKDFSHAKKIDILTEGKKVIFTAEFPRQNTVALVFTLKNLLHNMVVGVQKGYTYRMKIVYSHFPITVDPPKKGSTEIHIKNFIGERASRVTHSIGDVVIKTNKDEVIVSGCDKEYVGQTCANIQKKCRIKDKDKRVFQDGVYVYQKELGDKILWQIK